LLEERRARQEAEHTLLLLQKEKQATKEATQKADQAQQQLNELLAALRKVVIAPERPENVRSLENLVRGARVTPNAQRGGAPAKSEGRSAKSSHPAPPQM